MPTLLDKAIDEIHKLSEAQQESIAAIILEELLDEQRWQSAFDNSTDQLSKLAQKVRGDIQAGRVKDMGFDVQ